MSLQKFQSAINPATNTRSLTLASMEGAQISVLVRMARRIERIGEKLNAMLY